MSENRKTAAWSPRAEELAAYAACLDQDDPGQELQRRIEGWLAAHPVERAEVEAQRRLLQLCRSTSPSDPSEAAWSLLWDRIKEAPAGVVPVPSRFGRTVAWSAALILGTAAAVLLAILPGLTPLPQKPPGADLAETEFFPVARADEVEILQVDGADTDALVVGELPLAGPVVLVGPKDVSLIRVENGKTKSGDAVRMEGRGSPMIVASTPSEAAE